MSKLRTIRKTFKSAKKIALFGHINPDGDCIGAMLGLGRLLEKQGKKCSYITPTAPSKVFDFLPGVKKIKTLFDYAEYDMIVFVDFSDYGRIAAFTEGHEKYFDNANLVIIDHHPGPCPEHALTIRDDHCMSAAELVFESTIKWRSKLFDDKVATYLYMGLTTDSGNFLFDDDHERILFNALQLVKLGANKNLIIDNLFRRRSLNVLKFAQAIFKRIEQKGDLLYVYYSDKDLKKYGVDQEESKYVLIAIQNVYGPKLVLLLRHIDGIIRGSLRSKRIKSSKIVDCNKIATAFGGGGHIPAAGFSVPVKGDFKKQINTLTNKISKMIK